MCSSYPGINFEITRQNWTIVICLSRPHNCKTGHFTSWKNQNACENVQKWKMHVQSVENYCFSVSNMQICDILVAVTRRRGCLNLLNKLSTQIEAKRKNAAVQILQLKQNQTRFGNMRFVDGCISLVSMKLSHSFAYFKQSKCFKNQ